MAISERPITQEARGFETVGVPQLPGVLYLSIDAARQIRKAQEPIPQGNTAEQPANRSRFQRLLDRI